MIGTPGTVLDWCTKYKLIDPKKITMFVLDEADVMIATQGHRDQSIRIQRCLPFKESYYYVKRKKLVLLFVTLFS